MSELSFGFRWGRIDAAFGDRNLVCSCVGMEAYGDIPVETVESVEVVEETEVVNPRPMELFLGDGKNE